MKFDTYINTRLRKVDPIQLGDPNYPNVWCTIIISNLYFSLSTTILYLSECCFLMGVFKLKKVYVGIAFFFLVLQIQFQKKNVLMF